VAEEVKEKDAIKAKEAVILGEFESVKSRMMLEKDRYTLALALIKDVRQEGGSLFSTDNEYVKSDGDPEEMEEMGTGELSWRKTSM
jgi:hypothetical protein